MRNYRIVDYFDVWFDSNDGYQVNNLCTQGVIALPDDWDKTDIMCAFKKIGYWKKSVRLASWAIDWNCSDDEHVEIADRNGMPLCRLELTDEAPYHLEGQFPYGPRKVTD